jgi:hypothetical protein
LRRKWSEHIIVEAKWSEKIESKQSETKWKNWSFFHLSMQKQSETNPISLQSNKKIYAKPAPPMLEHTILIFSFHLVSIFILNDGFVSLSFGLWAFLGNFDPMQYCTVHISVQGHLANIRYSIYQCFFCAVSKNKTW